MALGGWIAAQAKGIRERSTDFRYSDFGRNVFPVPPTDEQAAIVRYLDHANRKIDKYVNSKKRLIKLLEEQKQAIIHKAVTRGIEPDVPMKDSGVDWLGQIPSHWDPVRNMALFSQRVESGIEGLTVLQVSLRSGISAEELDQFGRPKRLIADATKYKLIRKDDIAYNTMRLWQGAVGVSPSDGLVSPAYVVLKARSGVYPKYYDYLFHTEVYKQQVNRVSTGIVSDRNRCYWDSFKQIANVRVPLDEQKEIVQRIESETESVNQTIDRARKEIDLLNEFRTRLTADVVTGKLDVREAAKSLPDLEEEALEEADEFELDEEELEAVED
jgi:type I restriction enzyme S subunit